nr:tetratricopeptide repeat protein [uncultured Desulfobacter sp.]
MDTETTAGNIRFDDDDPWPGLHEFTEAGKDFFKGRGAEKAELFRLVRDARLVVQFGRSGLGKTSLIQAGLFPHLRRENYLPVYVRIDPRDRTTPLIEQISKAFFEQLQKREADYPTPSTGEGLWEYLHRRDLEFWSRQNHLLTPVFVLDQFEEVFTLGAENAQAVSQLRTDLTDLIENSIPSPLTQLWDNGGSQPLALDVQSQCYKILISLREDFLPELEGWRQVMPSLMRNRMRLMPMNGSQAFDAVYETGGKKLVNEKTAKDIVRFVAAVQKKERAGQDPLKAPESRPSVQKNDQPELPISFQNLVIEPALLSLVCSELNSKRKAENKNKIDRELLDSSGQDILHQFYKKCIQDMPEQTRRFIEDELISEGGFRNTYPRKDAADRGVISDKHLQHLVDSRLLRIESRMGSDRIELVHDLLTGVIRKSRNQYRIDQEIQQRKAAEDELKRQIKEEQQRARRRMYLAVGMGFVSLLCLIFAYISIQQTAKAQTAEEQAVQAQRQAEDLANFMLTDLKEKLEPMGRLDLLASLLDKTMEYYGSMNRDRMTDESTNNRAIALRSLSQIEKERGDLAKALIYSKQALELRKSLCEKDLCQIQWQSLLSETYMDLGDIERKRGNFQEAIGWYESSHKIRKQLASSHKQNALMQKDFAVSIRKMAEIALIQGDLAQAIAVDKQAIDIMLHLIRDDPENLSWKKEQLKEYTLIGDIELKYGNTVKAKLFFQKCLQICKCAVNKAAGNAGWLRDLAIVYDNLGSIEKSTGNSDLAREYFQKYLEISERLAKKDSANTTWQRNLAIAYYRVGCMEKLTGETNLARQYFQKQLEISKHLAQKDPANTTWQRDLAIVYYNLGSIEKSMGSQDLARDYFLQHLEISKNLAEKDPANTTWQRDLAIAYYRVGAMKKSTGGADPAKKYFQKHLEISKRLAEKDPTNTTWQRDLAIAYYRLGSLEKSTGRPDLARQYFQKHFQICRCLVEKDPKNIQWQKALHHACDRLSRLYEQSNDQAQAKLYADQAAKIREKIEAFNTSPK